MRRDDAKDAGEGAVVVAGTYASTGSLTASALAAAAVVFKLGFNAIAGRDTRRAEELFARMAEADEAPAAFRAHLEDRIKSNDEDVLSALRTLITASLEALSPDGVKVIAMLGRQHLRKEAPAWIVRAWVRVVVDLSTDEISVLRELAEGMRAAMMNGATTHRIHDARTDQQGIALLLTKSLPGHSKYNLAGRPKCLVAMSSLHGYSNYLATGDHAERFFELLQHHGAASRRETWLGAHRAHVKDFESAREERPGIELRHATVITLIRAFWPSEREPLIGL